MNFDFSSLQGKRLYLAIPYTHKSKKVREVRAAIATYLAGEMMEQGAYVYSPITHGHVIGQFNTNISGEFHYWENHCLSFVEDWAECLIVADLQGWKESLGVQKEIEVAQNNGKAVLHLDKAELIEHNFLLWMRNVVPPTSIVFLDSSFTDYEYDLGRLQRKYRLTNTTKTSPNGKPLFRIEALKSFGNIIKGQLGGWIESEQNLSHDCNAWIADEAMVYDKARVFDEAQVSGLSQVCGSAKVCGKSHISQCAYVADNAEILECGHVLGHAKVLDCAKVFGTVLGDVEIGGNTWVLESETIHEPQKIYPPKMSAVQCQASCLEDETTTFFTL